MKYLQKKPAAYSHPKPTQSPLKAIDSIWKAHSKFQPIFKKMGSIKNDTLPSIEIGEFDPFAGLNHAHFLH